VKLPGRLGRVAAERARERATRQVQMQTGQLPVDIERDEAARIQQERRDRDAAARAERPGTDPDRGSYATCGWQITPLDIDLALNREAAEEQRAMWADRTDFDAQ
jgi:hypothetical protein